MKILDVNQIRAADQYTIEHEPIASIDLMERAAGACFKQIRTLFDSTSVFYIFCGPGNNGGDGLAIARMLIESGKKVQCYRLPSAHYSADNALNASRLEASGTVINDSFNPISFDPKGVIIDALFGTGLSRPLDGLAARAVELINESGLTIISVDLPSGLYERDNTTKNLTHSVKATHTLSFQLPKFCFFLQDLAEYIGSWTVLDIGLDPSFIDRQTSTYSSFEMNDAISHLRPRPEHGHKGTFGHAMVIGGSSGKIGAIQLAAKACMRSGTGLTTAYVPGCANVILQETLPELMLQFSTSDDHISGNPDFTGISAIGIGPGMGTAADSAVVLQFLLTSSDCPIVIDADALNVLSKDKQLLNSLPKGTILTPHQKEFDRLFGHFNTTEERILFMQDFAQKNEINILLKGHNSASALASGEVIFNTSGNSGLAKGGSGDTLTGIITALLAQSYPSEVALPLAVFIHGEAADLAIEEFGTDALLATDVIQYLPKVFQLLRSQE